MIDPCKGVELMHNCGIFYTMIFTLRMFLSEIQQKLKLLTSERQHLYSIQTIQLVYELRNISKSPQTDENDIWTINYDMSVIFESRKVFSTGTTN